MFISIKISQIGKYIKNHKFNQTIEIMLLLTEKSRVFICLMFKFLRKTKNITNKKSQHEIVKDTNDI